MSKIAPKPDKQRKFTDAQVITTALLEAKKFYGNSSSALDFLASYEGFYRLDKAGLPDGVFSMRLHRLSKTLSRKLPTYFPDLFLPPPPRDIY